MLFNNNAINKEQNPNFMTPIDIIHANRDDKQNRLFKLLGIYIEKNLNFTANIAHLCAKISKSVFIINTANNFLNDKSLTTLYC